MDGQETQAQMGTDKVAVGWCHEERQSEEEGLRLDQRALRLGHHSASRGGRGLPQRVLLQAEGSDR